MEKGNTVTQITRKNNNLYNVRIYTPYTLTRKVGCVLCVICVTCVTF